MTRDEEATGSTNRRRMLAGLASAGVVSVAGCTSSQFGSDGEENSGTTASGEVDAPQGGTLTISQAKGPVEFDPVVLNDVPSSEIASRVFEGLYTYDEGTTVITDLATKMPEVTREGTRYVVPIDENATFSNGDPVTADDVTYSVTAPVTEQTENASSFNMIDEASAVDEKTVQFDLEFPFGPFRHTLTANVVPKAVREEDKEEFKLDPVGSGPFLFEEFQEGELTRLSVDDDYWGSSQPNVDAVEFRPVEEPTTRLTTLQNDENLVIKNVPPKLFDSIRNMEKAGIQEQEAVSYFYLAMNCNEGPTTDPRVREAVDYVFDMDQAVSEFVEPAGVRQHSPIPGTLAEEWEFPTDEWGDVQHDKNIEEAQRLFDEAGVPTDYSWRIIVPPDKKRENIGVTVSNGLKEAGFSDVTVQRLDWGAFLDRYVTGKEDDYNLFTLGWSGLPDPSTFMYPLFARTDDALGATNGCYYGANSDAGKRVSEKIVQARQSNNFDERQQLYVDAIGTILEDRPHIPAYNLKQTYGVNERVNDFLAHPVDQFHLVTEHNNVSIADQ